jgi:NADH:quinone reductase (non-electrogenic)
MTTIFPRRRVPAADRDVGIPARRRDPSRPHRVLILGGGFAGVLTAQEIEKRTRRRDDVEIWLVNRENFMLFTPLLPEVCSGTLEARHCVTALRAMLRRHSSWALTATVEKIDLDGQLVTVLGGDGDEHRLAFDTLVVALGGETSTFNIPGIHEYAAGMKTLADAFALRNRVIEMLERAELEADPAERQAQLTFVVGGAGLSGVETAGEIEAFIRRLRRRYYPAIGADEVRVYLVELKDRILPEMPAEMGEYAARMLARRGFEVMLGTPIKEVRPDAVVLGDERREVPTRTVIWTGGVQPLPLVAASGLECDRAGRAITRPTMETSHPAVFAIGDCARIPNPDDPDGPPHAPTAQNAVREARRLAQNILARIDGRPLRPFRYQPVGTLASIGHHTGVGVVFGVRVRGLLAWFMWRGYYWTRVPGFNRKVRVAIDWALEALFGSDPVQLKVEYDTGGLGPSGIRRPRRRFIDPRS